MSERTLLKVIALAAAFAAPAAFAQTKFGYCGTPDGKSAKRHVVSNVFLVKGNPSDESVANSYLGHLHQYVSPHPVKGTVLCMTHHRTYKAAEEERQAWVANLRRDGVEVKLLDNYAYVGD